MTLYSVYTMYKYFTIFITLHRTYWSKTWPFHSDNSSSLISSRRFELILRFLHLADSNVQPQRGEPGFDKLFKLRPLLNLLLPRFRDSYTPNQYLSIDENMISFKGRLSFLQYLPKKPHKWGMKAWVLADTQTGYTWAWKLYTGKEGDRGDKGLAHRVVMELVEDERLQGKGYVVVTDNFYSSPALFRELKQRGFGACGTTRRDRRSIPQTARDAKLQRGDVISSRDDGILSLKWKDKRDVTLLSTYLDDSMVTKKRRSRAAQGGVEDIMKPKVVEDYNKNMGGVDKSKWLLQFCMTYLLSFGSLSVPLWYIHMYLHRDFIVIVHVSYIQVIS